MRDSIGAALKFKGRSLNSTNVTEVGDAGLMLLDAKKRSLGFESGVGGKYKVLARHAQFAMAYSGDAMRGIKDDPETYYFIPIEGSQIWVDNLAGCAKAPNRIVAEKFLTFILNPEVGA